MARTVSSSSRVDELALLARCEALLEHGLEPLRDMRSTIEEYGSLAFRHRESLAKKAETFLDVAVQVVDEWTSRRSLSIVRTLSVSELERQPGESDQRHLSRLGKLEAAANDQIESLAANLQSAQDALLSLKILRAEVRRLRWAPAQFALLQVRVKGLWALCRLCLFGGMLAVALTVDSNAPFVERALHRLFEVVPPGSSVVVLFVLQALLLDPIIERIRTRLEIASACSAVATIRASVVHLDDLDRRLARGEEELRLLQAALAE